MATKGDRWAEKGNNWKPTPYRDGTGLKTNSLGGTGKAKPRDISAKVEKASDAKTLRGGSRGRC